MTFLWRLIRYWSPPALWMTLIFYLSSRLRVTVTGAFLFDFLIFKILHVFEYAILYFLLFRAFHSLPNKNFSLNQKYIFPLITSILYAISDELHQTFVPTREGKLRDVAIDVIGILLMYIYITNYYNLVKRLL